MDNTVHQCTSQKEIEKLNRIIEKLEQENERMGAEINRISSVQYTDHDVLIRLDVGVVNIKQTLEDLVTQVSRLNMQPANLFNQIKTVLITTGATTVLIYFFNLLIKGK